MTLSTLLTGGSFFEGPRWHQGHWWVSDFYRGQVLQVSTSGEETVVLEVPTQPSGSGRLPDGSLVVVSMTDQRLLRWDGSELATYAALAPYCGGLLNDLVVDAAGHVFVGDFGFDLMAGGAPAPASLKRVDPDGTITVVAEDLLFPNGMVITADGGTLLVGETLGNRYTAFDLAEDGSLSNRRVWAEFGPAPTGTTLDEVLGSLVIAPDGCSGDAEGHVWAADAVGGRVVRVAPGGEVVDTVAAPEGMGVFACALGGDDGRTLLLCCAPDFLEHARRPVREAVLLTTTVAVPHAGRP